MLLNKGKYGGKNGTIWINDRVGIIRLFIEVFGNVLGSKIVF